MRLLFWIVIIIVLILNIMILIKVNTILDKQNEAELNSNNIKRGLKGLRNLGIISDTELGKMIISYDNYLNFKDCVNSNNRSLDEYTGILDELKSAGILSNDEYSRILETLKNFY